MLFFLLLLLCFPLLTPTAASAENHWFDRHSEGWFWYEHIPEQQKKQDGPEISSAVTALQPLSTAWIRNNIGQYLDKAIDHPSKENVSAYLYLDRLVKEKAEQFAHVGKQVIESDPMLDENVRRPISPAAAKVRDDVAHQAKESVLRKIAKKAGLVFYYQGTCKLCHLQAQTVQLISEQYDFELISFSTDGALIPSLPDSRIDRTPHPKLNIQTYPALFLMQPPEKIVLLRQGSSSFTALTERMVEVAFEQRWIGQNDYQRTRINQENWTHTFSDFHPLKASKTMKIQLKQ